MSLGLICSFVKSCWNLHWTISFRMSSRLLSLSYSRCRRTGIPMWAKVNNNNNNNNHHLIFSFNSINPLGSGHQRESTWLQNRASVSWRVYECQNWSMSNDCDVSAWAQLIPTGVKVPPRASMQPWSTSAPQLPANPRSTVTKRISQTLFQDFCKPRDVSSGDGAGGTRHFGTSQDCHNKNSEKQDLKTKLSEQLVCSS